MHPQVPVPLVLDSLDSNTMLRRASPRTSQHPSTEQHHQHQKQEDKRITINENAEEELPGRCRFSPQQSIIIFLGVFSLVALLQYVSYYSVGLHWPNNPDTPLMVNNNDTMTVAIVDDDKDSSDAAWNTTTPVAQPQPLPETDETATVFFRAFDANGSPGYVADPQTLRRSTTKFINDNNNANGDRVRASWKLYTEYDNNGHDDDYDAKTAVLGQFRTHLTHRFVCSWPPGQGLEEDGGYKLLTEQLRIHDYENQIEDLRPRGPKRILCLIYTHTPMHPLARAAALTWGRQCDGFLAFTNNTTDPRLGLVHLEHEGDEAYANMFQKVRSIWAYVHTHYRQDYDYFHLGGDDVYLLVPNLRYFLNSIKIIVNHSEPFFAGQIVPHGPRDTYIAGGAGYTLNQAALDILIQVLPTCNPHKRASFEDRLISGCLKQAGVSLFDTRDELGRQRYHDCSPHHLMTSRAAINGQRRASFHSRAAAYWETLPLPGTRQQSSDNSSTLVGPQVGLETASPSSVAFHNIFTPLYMVRLHAILYHTCPTDTVLGKALSQG